MFFCVKLRPMKKTVLIVDDHELFRAGIVGLLSAIHPEFNLLEASSDRPGLRSIFLCLYYVHAQYAVNSEGVSYASIQQ